MTLGTYSLGVLMLASLFGCSTVPQSATFAPMSRIGCAVPEPRAGIALYPLSPSSESASASVEASAPAAAPAPEPLVVADTRQSPFEGQSEVTVSGVGQSDKNFDSGGFNLTASFGKFLTDDFELSLRQNLANSDGPNTSSVWNGSTRLAADFNLGSGDMRPFLGANFGYVYGDLVKDSWMAAPEGGMKFYVSEHTFLQLLVEYQFFFDQGNQIDNAFSEGSFVYSLGFGINF